MSSQIPSQKIMNSLKKMSEPSTGKSINELRMILALERIVARFDRHPKLSQGLVFKLCTNKTKLKKSIVNTFNGRGTKVPDSFHSIAKDYDLELLKRAWTAVEQMGTEISFETSWRSFLSVLKSLDS